MNKTYRQFVKNIPATVVLFNQDENEDGQSRPYVRRYTRKQLFRELMDGGAEGLEDITLSDAADIMNIDAVYSAADWDQAERDRHRRKLEHEASKLARQYNVAPGSMEFIQACHEEIARTQTYREGMREDGLCIGWGVTPDQWYEEFNASQSDTSAVHDILNWLEEACPLLMAQYNEQQLKNAN